MYLSVFSISSVDNSCAAYFGNPFPMAVKAPAANLIRADHILDE